MSHTPSSRTHRCIQLGRSDCRISAALTVGRFVEPEHYVTLCLRQMGAGETSDQVVASATLTLRSIIQGSARGWIGPYVSEILDVVAVPDFLRSNHAALKAEGAQV